MLNKKSDQHAISVLSKCLWSSLAIPLLIHLVFWGAYTYNPGYHVFWIGPIGTTLPYVVMTAVTMLVIRQRAEKNQSPTPPIIAFVVSWVAMMSLTIWILLLEHGPEQSSTMSLAIVSTPPTYFVLFVAAWLIGYLGGQIITTQRGA